MRIEPLERITPAFQQIGATELSRSEEQESGEITYVIYYAYRGHLIRAAWNIVNDLNVRVSAEPTSSRASAHWRPLFSFTVPGFDQFDREQKLNWVLSVPDGPAADAFIGDHVRKLPASLPTP